MTTPRPVASGQTWRRARRVLLVDNDPTYRGRLNALFTDWHWELLEASSGREALDILDRHTIDVVLLDVALQDIDCAEIVAAVRQRTRALPVVIMSARMTPELRRAWRSRGVMECLSKPVAPKRCRRCSLHVYHRQGLQIADGRKDQPCGVETRRMKWITACKIRWRRL